MNCSIISQHSVGPGEGGECKGSQHTGASTHYTGPNQFFNDNTHPVPPPARAAPLLHKNNSLVDNNLTHLFQKLQKVPFGSAVCFPPQSRALRTHDGFKIGWLFRALEAGCSLAVFCCCCFEILVPSRGVFPKTPPKTTINLQNRHFAKTPKINPKKTQIFVLA